MTFIICPDIWQSLLISASKAVTPRPHHNYLLREITMRIVHRIVGRILQNVSGVSFVFGIVSAFLLHHFVNSSIVIGLHDFTTQHIKFLFIFTTIFTMLGLQAAEIFYTEEKYNEYRKGHVNGRSWRLKPLEPYFYPTMVSDIGITRKIAGYVYALSQIYSIGVFSMFVLIFVFIELNRLGH